MRSFISSIRVYLSKERVIMQLLGKKKQKTDPDLVVTIHLCAVHKDFFNQNGALDWVSILRILPRIQLCGGCKVEIVC